MGQRSMEAFLEEAFGVLQPTSEAIGRVLVHPKYIDESEIAGLRNELVRCIRRATMADIDLSSPQGYDLRISADYPLLSKYLEVITLLREGSPIGSWVQVEPPGSAL